MSASLAGRIEAVLFDKDGTLFDFQRSWGAWARELIIDLAEGNRERADAMADAMAFDTGTARFRPESPVIASTGDEVAALLLPHVPTVPGGLQGLSRRLAQAAARVPQIEAVPLAELLDRLAAGGLRLGVATNDHEATARHHLAAHLARFDFIAGFDSGHGAKPGAGMLLAFARYCGLNPARVLMVGDSRHDLLAGQAAGMPTLAVLTGVAGAVELTPLADHLRPDIGHLPAMLGLN